MCFWLYHGPKTRHEIDPTFQEADACFCESDASETTPQPIEKNGVRQDLEPVLIKRIDLECSGHDNEKQAPKV